MLKLKILGPFEALLNGAPLSNLRLRSGEQMLAFLALHHDQSLQSDWLAQLFWRGENPAASLRQCLAHLHNKLGPEKNHLEAANKTVVFRLQDAEVDVNTFDRQIAAGDTASLKAAIRLYNGPLLQGWEMGWIWNEREQREERYLEALQMLADQATGARDYVAAARYLRRMANARPSLVSAWCALMEALVNGEEYIEALEIYRRCRDSYRKAKLEPPAKMTELYERIMQEQMQLKQQRRFVAPELQPDFVGYESVGGAVPLNSTFYISRLADAELQAAILRHDSTILIKGVRQAGKTSLMARGLEQARQVGMKVVITDLSKIDEVDMATRETFLQSLARSLADQLNAEVTPGSVWHAERPANDNFERYVRREVLNKTTTRLVWGIDEADRLFSYAYKDNIFGLFRAWHNERSLSPQGPWERLTLILSYATEAYLTSFASFQTA